MEFETLRESSILAGTDAVEHSSIAKNWTSDMQQSFPYQHKNVLEDAMDTIFKLSCTLKEETKNEMSTSSSFWVTIFFLSIFAFIVLVSLGLSCLVFIVSIIVTAYALVQHFMSYVDGYVENVVISAFDDCDILDKAIYSTGNVNNYSMVTIKARKDMRSRNAKYVYYNYCRVRLCKQRDREPSRLPLRTLKRLEKKSKKLRDIVYDYLRSNTPKSSKMHGYVKIKKIKRYDINTKPTNRFLYKARQYFSFFSCNRPMSLYKTPSHAANVCKFKLRTDIEKNPGPTSVEIDPSKTIRAPYSQGNELVFGPNAGQQCAAMSLCSLIYNYKMGINSSSDLVQIMNIGNQLYSSLSLLARQSYLMITELPTMLNVFETTYQVRFSESYSGTVDQENTMEAYQYRTSLQTAFESLMCENYRSFILTVGCITVAIYYTNNEKFKIFDSHARDLYGNSHPQGTCVLLEASSVNDLVQYFQSIHYNDTLFEVKGIQINEVQNGITVPVLPQNQADKTNQFNLSCAVAIYSLCYAVMTPCSYWNSTALGTIMKNSNELYHLPFNKNLTFDCLPKIVNIYGAEVSVNLLNARIKGVLSSSLPQSKSILEDIIIHNSECTGFLMWFGTYCICCILRPTRKSRYMYSCLTYNESQVPQIQFIKSINSIASLVEVISTIQKKNQFTEHYEIQFLCCSCNNLDRSERKKIMKNQRDKIYYDNMEPSKKKKLSEKKYKKMDSAKKRKLFNRNAEKYKSMDSRKKKELINNAQQRKKENCWRNKTNDIFYCIEQFKKKIKEGPYYICCVCNRGLYKKSVLKLIPNMYPCQDIFNRHVSYDKEEYICKTCRSKAIQGRLPCQAVVNKLRVDDIPTELQSLKKLEQILIAQRIVFEKIVVMPKGQQRKIKGAICNVPVQCDETCSILPRPPERSGIILLKLKRKLQFRGHVYFEAVRPEIVISALNWLKVNNPLYKKIEINCTNFGIDFTNTPENEDNDNSLGDNSSTNNFDNTSGKSINSDISPKNPKENNCDSSDGHEQAQNYEEEVDDPLNEHRSPANETCLQSAIPDYPVITEEVNTNKSTGREIYNIAPGENKHPVCLMTDKLCEELAFPVLFPKGKFGYTAERDIKLSPVKYFNARLLHYSGRFASNPEYLFFAQFIIEQKKVSDSINIALKKVHGQPVTASQVRSNTQVLQNLISQDQAYLFLRQIPGSPPYWQKFMYEVVAMVKQLGIPTWFMTLSCADLRWPELFQIISRANGANMTDEEVDALSYDERCRLLNINPVIVAKHFQYRVETFFTEVLLSRANPIGKIVYYALCIEFQVRGSPHLHALIWTSDCPKLSHNTKQQYIKYIDQHVQAYLPDKDKDLELYELVKKYQTHSHSKTCRKYKNISCRFEFGQFFTDKTIVAEPLSEDMNSDIKTELLTKRKEILSLVKQKIDESLNPSKADYNPLLTPDDIFKELGVTKQQYEKALSVSPDSDFDLHLRRPIDSCFTNNYFIAGIKGFAANVDLQPVFNHFKCITYVCSYFTKDETECSNAIMNAAKEAKESNLNIRDGLRKIGAAFLSSREVSSQECVYRCMPELWLRKIFPKTVFVSTALPENRLRIAKTRQQLDDLEDESTDIYKSNIIERYSIRPKSIKSVNEMCLAEFAAYYYKDYKTDLCESKDAQPEVLSDDIIEQAHVGTTDDASVLPKQIRLINTKEVMKCRKVRAVIRYHTPNKTKEPEQYFHHLLILYYPWRKETELLGNENTYMSKFNEPDVQLMVQRNKNIFEPDSEAVIEALESLRSLNDIRALHSYDALNDQENDDLQSQIENTTDEEESFNNQMSGDQLAPSKQQSTCTSAISSYNQVLEISDDDLRNSVRSLNSQQRKAYNLALTWCRNKIKNTNSLKPVQVPPVHLFITGGGGAGKSHLIKAIYHTVTKSFRYTSMNPELPTVLLMAPTGVAAINISGTTIHTALAIPRESGVNLTSMSDQKRTQLRLGLIEMKVIIIDEISMVSNTTLLHIHQRLKEIFATPANQLFAGLSLIVVGDFYQLPPIRSRPVFDNYKNEMYNLYHPWAVFKMIELTEIMRQKDDQPFTQLLDRFRTASHTEDDIRIIQSKSISPTDPDYPSHALHIWAENAPVDEHNNKHLQQLSGPVFTLKAVDQYPPNVTKQDIDRVLSLGRSDTGGLDAEIQVKENARVMLTTNIDINDRLINGQIGTIVKIAIKQNTNKPSVIFIKFDDPRAGVDAMLKCTDIYARKYTAVPIQPVLARIKVRPGKPSSPEIQRLQFPITLAWACTVHKVQGLTLKEAVVSFELQRQNHFNFGQIYVALSRVTSLQGLHIIGHIEDRHIRANPKVHLEYQRLRQIEAEHSTSLTHTSVSTNVSYKLSVCLLNIRSLRKHSVDIKCDVNLMKTDILALTETHLLPNNSDTEIQQNLTPFIFHRQDHTIDKYLSLAVCTKQNIFMLDKQYISSINALKFVIFDSVTHHRISFLLLYRKNTSNVHDYISKLSDLLNISTVDIIMGDFNINFFNVTDIKQLKELMSFYAYIQIVQNATFLPSGSLLDHIYVKKTERNLLKMLKTNVVSVYYSDHEAVEMVITYKSSL